MINYGFNKEVNLSFDKAIEKISDELKKEGFGILTRIDVNEKIKEKLGVKFKKYVILGACNPKYAYKAILAEENIGLLIPCNIIVYEQNDKIIVSVIKPKTMMQLIENDVIKEIANIIELKLKHVFDSLN